MPMFEALKKSLGMSKEKEGNILGSKDQNSTGAGVANGGEYKNFNLKFTEAKLGMGVNKYYDENNNISVPIVSTLAPDSEAERLGVKVGDLIIALENNKITEFEDFYTIVGAIGRPVLISFRRKNVLNSTNNNKPSAGGNFMNFGNKSNSNNSVQLSEEEKAKRREMMTSAAVDRTIPKWEKKKKMQINQPSAPSVEPVPVVPEKDLNPETKRVIEQTKQMEKKVEQSLGYSPFRPHMSFSGNNTNNIGAAESKPVLNPTSTVTHESGINPNQTQIQLPTGEFEVEPEWIAEVDEAFAMILSLGEEDQENAQTAVQTVLKMCKNLEQSPGELKLRSIRLSNQAFQNKVVKVCGAIELLKAAGYRPKTQAGSTNNPDAENGLKENYLVHEMDAESQKRLVYVIKRIREMLSLIVKE